MFGRILTGLIIVVIGYFTTAKADWLMNNLGRIEWFETHLGAEGGTRTFYKLFGVFLIIVGFLLATGWLGDIAASIFRPITRGIP